jgi:predicted metal-dependent phosphoesterase TrpH
MPDPLLCEFHAHTTWSDGVLTPAELVDLYGRSGFDVLAITDHVVRDQPAAQALAAADHPAYLEEIEREAERAAALYGLLVIPGLELTYDDPDPRLGAHAVAVGLRRYVDVNRGLELALAEASAEGAALIAAHPYRLGDLGGTTRTTARWSEEAYWAAAVVDRFEVCNRHEFFPWVAQERLPVVASGDFHWPEHLATWKTLVPAEKSEEAMVAYLRSGKPVSLLAVEVAGDTLRPAA